MIAGAIPDMEQSRYHECLNLFYANERNKHFLERVYLARTRHLVAEAHYHQGRIKKRRQLLPLSDPISMEPFGSKPESFTSQPLSVFPEPTINPIGIPMNQRSPLPWPHTSLSSELEEEVEINRLLQAESLREREKIPISIQIEPTASISPTVRLTEEDLEKLADLITKTDYRPQSRQQGAITAPEQLINIQETELLKPDVLPDSKQAEAADLNLDEISLAKWDPEEWGILKPLEQAIAQHNREQIAAILLQLGQYRLKKGLFQNAELCLLKAVELAKSAASPVLEVQLHEILGHTYQERFQHNKALRHLREVEHLYETNPHLNLLPDSLAHAYADMGDIFLFRKEMAEALAAYRKSLALSNTDMVFQKEIMFKLALTLDEAGKIEEALSFYRQNYELSATLQDNQACAATLYNLASLYYEQSRLSEAQQTLEQCLGYDKSTGTNHEVFRSLMLLSKICEAKDALEQAKRYALDAYQSAQTVSSKTDMAAACIRLGQLSSVSKAWQEAASYYQQALTVANTELSQESRQRIQKALKIVQEHLS